MKITKIAAEVLTFVLIYGALTIIIAGGFALSMGFARAAIPNASNLPEVQKDNGAAIPPGQASFFAVPSADSSAHRE